ncbi:MAG: putative transposase, partial [Euryarchaeota archaeon]|nr:putative transposase [Euryarchaeota archaeon]
NMRKSKHLKAVEIREKNIVKDLNHKISRKIVDVALYNGCGIKLENLKGIRKLNSKIGDAGKGEKNKNKNKKREQNRAKSRSK